MSEKRKQTLRVTVEYSILNIPVYRNIFCGNPDIIFRNSNSSERVMYFQELYEDLDNPFILVAEDNENYPLLSKGDYIVFTSIDNNLLKDGDLIAVNFKDDTKNLNTQIGFFKHYSDSQFDLVKVKTNGKGKPSSINCLVDYNEVYNIYFCSTPIIRPLSEITKEAASLLVNAPPLKTK